MTRTTFTDQNGDELGWMTFRVLKYAPAQPVKPVTDASHPAKPGRIRPPLGHDNGPWWEEVAQGRIPIQKCRGCGALHHPPRPMCAKCGGMEMGFIAASGRGTVHSFTVIHHPQFPGYEFPIIAALIDLEEGTRLMSSLTDCKPEQVSIGMRVQGYIHEDEDGFKLPLFRPAGS